MSELILHIGNRKTGSSALQVFFANNRTLLEDKGIVYPMFDGTPNYFKQHGDFLRAYCLKLCRDTNNKRFIDNNLTNYHALKSDIENCQRSNKKLLISNENLSNLYYSEISHNIYW